VHGFPLQNILGRDGIKLPRHQRLILRIDLGKVFVVQGRTDQEFSLVGIFERAFRPSEG
jgi:hypothetical protein